MWGKKHLKTTILAGGPVAVSCKSMVACCQRATQALMVEL
jgi:hypothetical protein